MLPKRKNEKGFTLIELIIVIVILGIIAGVAIPKFIGLSGSARLSAARGVGGAISSTISALHANYLINGTAYTVAEVLGNTQFSGGITYNSTNSATPASGDITANGNNIWLNYKTGNFGWTYTAASGDTAATIAENTSSDF